MHQTFQSFPGMVGTQRKKPKTATAKKDTFNLSATHHRAGPQTVLYWERKKNRSPEEKEKEIECRPASGFVFPSKNGSRSRGGGGGGRGVEKKQPAPTPLNHIERRYSNLQQKTGVRIFVGGEKPKRLEECPSTDQSSRI